MRRSSRERKTVDFYTAEVAPSTRRKSNSSAVVSSSDEESSDDDETSHTLKRVPGGKKVVQPKSSSVHKRTKKFSSASASAIAQCRSKNAIFHAISSNKALPATADKWYTFYGENNVSAMADLVNALLLAAGSRDDCIPANVDLEGLDSAELEEVLSDMVTSVKEQQSVLLGSKKTSKSKNSPGDMGYCYPLSTQDRSPTSFRSHFQSFWNILLTKVLTLQQQQASKKLNMNTVPMRILLSLVEILMALSNVSALPSVRDAVTEALLQICATVLEVCVLPLREQIASSRRQGSAAAEGSAKLTAIQALQSKAEQSLEHFQSLVNTIFNTIFVHRYKDHFAVIRATCAFYLGRLMLADPQQFVEDTYLKYLGWLANDKSAAVRRAVVSALVAVLSSSEVAAVVSVSQRLREFSERFIDRWVEMAVCDADEEVCFGMLRVLRQFQKLGLIDDIEQEKLDVVDKVVFDAEASARVRSEALLFLMDHTEGFEEDEGGDEDAAEDEDEGGQAKKRGSAGQRQGRRKSGMGTGGEHRELKRQKRLAVQLETFAEFVEYHLGEEEGGSSGGERAAQVLQLHEEAGAGAVGCERLATVSALADKESNLVVLLAEACLSLPRQSAILRGWDTFASLLLRESDSLITTALKDCHISTLLRLLVCSAGQLYQWKHEHNQQHQAHQASVGGGVTRVEDYDEDEEQEGGGAGSKRKRKVGTENQAQNSLLGDWQQLVTCVVHSLPKLLTRFSDNEANVSLLLQLLDYCAEDVMCVSSGPENSDAHGLRFSDQALRSLFKAVLGQLQSSQSLERVGQLANVLRLWMNSGGGVVPGKGQESSKVQNMLRSGVDALLAESAHNIVAGTQTLQGLLLGGRGFAQKRRSGAVSHRGDSDDQEVVGNCLFELSAALVKMTGLWQCLDCRSFYAEPMSAEVEMLEQISSTLLQLASGEGYVRFLQCEDGARGGESALTPVLLSCCQSSAKCLQAICLWHTRDVFVHARQLRQEEEHGDMQVGEEAPSSVTASRDQALAVRDVLVGVLDSRLALHLATEDADVPLVVRQLQGEAFRMVGDLRLQFPQKLRDDYSPLVGSLAWEPSSALILHMQKMFSREEELIRQALEALENVEDDEDEEGTADSVAPSKREKQQCLANHLMWTLLNPLGSIRHDVEHLNRRQAAAILGYLVFESSPQVQTMVNSWLKKLKEKDIGKYLESMLLALKKCFEDFLLNPLKEHQAALALLESYEPPPLVVSQRGRGRAGQDAEDREEALEQDVAMWAAKVRTGWTRVSQLSKRFAQTLGVGKCSGEVATFVVQLLEVASKYALQSVQHLAFFQAGESFLGHLKAAQVDQVRQALSSLVFSLQREATTKLSASTVLEAISQVYFKNRPAGDDELLAEDRTCVDAFFAFGEKVGLDVERVLEKQQEDEEQVREERFSPVAVSAEDVDIMLQVSPLPAESGGSGRRRAVGGRRSSGATRYTSVGDDDVEDEDEDEEDEEGMEIITATVVAGGASGSRSLASGLHLQDIDDEEEDEDEDIMVEEVVAVRRSRNQKDEVSQGVSTQSSEEDLFEDFDLRKTHRKYA